MSNQYSFNKREIDEIVQWELIFETLSIDLVKPFLAEMGLVFLDANSIQTTARQFLQQIKNVDDDMEQKRKILQRVLARLKKNTNADSAQKLYKWGQWIIVSRKRNELYPWSVLLPWLAGLYRIHIPIVWPPLAQQKLDDIIRVTQYKLSDDFEIEARLENAERLPKSEWDKIVYQKSEDKKYSPLILASNIITANKVQQIWNLINSLLSKAELEILLQWAKENAASLQVKPESIRLPVSFLLDKIS